MVKCCFTLKSFLSNTNPRKKRSIVQVTAVWFWILFQANSISSLQWISSNTRIVFSFEWWSNISKYRRVGSSRWLPSIKAKSTCLIFSKWKKCSACNCVDVLLQLATVCLFLRENNLRVCQNGWTPSVYCLRSLNACFSRLIHLFLGTHGTPPKTNERKGCLLKYLWLNKIFPNIFFSIPKYLTRGKPSM